MQAENKNDKNNEFSLDHVIKSAIQAIKYSEHHPQVDLRGRIDSKSANPHTEDLPRGGMMRAGPAEPNPLQFSTTQESKRHAAPFANWVTPENLPVKSHEWNRDEYSPTEVAGIARGALASLARR